MAITSKEHSENNFEHTGRNIFQLPWIKAIHRSIYVAKLHIKILRFLIIAFVIKEFSVPEILLYYPGTHYFFLTLSTWSIFILFSFNSNFLDVLKYFYHSFFSPNVMIPFMFRICSFRNILFFILFFFFLLASYQRQSTSHLQSLIVIFFMQGSERVLHYASFQLIVYQWGREGHIQLCFLALSGNYLKFWDFKILVKCSFSSNPRAFIFPFWIFMDNLLVSLKNIRTYFFY